MRRYLLLILCLSFALSSLMGQSSVLPNKANDDISVIVNDSLMFIGQNVDSLTEEQRYFNPLYLIVQKGKEYLKKQLIRASVCDCDTTVPNRRIGIFSVAPNKYVSFSQGNLQYFPAANLWKFADNQYEYLGASNKYLSPTYRNWVDLFGWSGEGSNAPFGVSTSTDNADYAGEFLDWGTNPICGDAANTWRTLSKNEWDYLLNDRKNATSLIGIANINGINGLVILPDSWTCPAGVTFKSGFHSSCGVDYYAAYQTFTADQWSKLEKSGAIFLPAAGYRRESDVYDVQNYGSYWATEYNGYQANDLDFLSCVARMDTTSRYCGQSVRLVHDTIVPTPAPCETFTVNGVSFNMMCVEGGTFTMGKGSDAHQVTLSDYYIGETEVTCGLWKAIMGSVPSIQSKYPDDYPVAIITLADCRQFVERLSELTGRNFRVPTEAEWEYAARGGKRSQGYTYAGSDDINEVAYWQGNVSRDDNGNIIHQPVPVKTRKPNELGTYDMTGNLCEWVSDWHGPYNKYPQINPTGPAVPANPDYPCHYRGGCWTYDTTESETTYRHGYYNRGASGIGLRLAMSDEEPFRAIYINDTIRFYLRPVEGGTFTMGEGSQAKQVNVSDYMMGQTEVTQALWKVVMGTTVENEYNSSTSGDALLQVGDNLPTAYLSWNDAQKFVERLNAMTGLYFRLPTEAEWIYAAKGGQRSKGYKYSGSDSLEEVAWCATNANGEIKPVGLLKPNELGIYDMCGNVWEFCNDVQSDGKIVAHGGSSSKSWSAAHYRPEYRYLLAKTYKANRLGLRLVMDTAKYIPTPCETFEVNGVKFNMMCVEGGTFMMGAMEGDSTASKNEFPQHSVTLSNYMIGQTEITKAQWLAVMGDKPKSAPASWLTADPQTPANYVTWSECVEFADRLRQLTGHNFRLPTEAEWEFAARGGTLSQGYRYSGSNNLDKVGWYIHNRQQTTHPVATKLPNELGIYDMSGNVWEWCLDSPKDYKDYAQLNPLPAFVNNQRVIRGGAYEREAYRCTNTHRTTWLSAWSHKGANMGFRVVLNDEHIIRTILLPDSIAFNMKHINGSTFMMGQTEVTRALWKAVMGSLPYNYTATDLPIARVTWNECQEFINQLNSLTGLYFRFPTKDEWLYAAKGGQYQEDFLYSGSNNIDEVGWYKDNSPGGIQSVAQLKPNALGIYDMTGNVWEWGAKNDSESCMYLGGSYAFSAESCLLSKALGYGNDSTHTGSIGLRLVLDTIQPFEPKYVDLGLSVMWATCNVGATKPEEYGNYFAWGETEPKTNYDWSTYKWCDGTESNITKYNDTDNLTTLLLEDDAAHVNWGGEWRMPSKKETQELIDNCTWQWTTQNNTKGYLVTSKLNGNSIFIPAAGYYLNKTFVETGGNGTKGIYWTSDLKQNNHSFRAYFIHFGESFVSNSDRARQYAHPIRPVLPTDREPLLPPAPCDTFEVNGVKFNMMCVEGGTFTMGTGSAAHQVTLSDYKIAQTELTQGLWEAVMGSDYNTILSKNSADIICLGPTHPAYALTWIDCQEFVNKLNQLTGLNFRMSTEAEWEFAARGGNRSRGYTYAGGNDLDAVAWHGLNSDNLLHPVAQKLPNELGIYDMAGNAWELCLDGYAAYATYSQTNPIIPVKGDVVARGGSSYNGWSEDIWLPTHRLNRSLVAPRTRNTLRLVLSDEVIVKTVVLDNNLTFNMIGVNSGTFMMGQTEVTQALWKAVMGTTLENEYNSSTSGDPLLQVGDNLPMAYLSWNDAQKFVERLNAMTGLYFRLPTEAEWIYAAKGGQRSKGYKFAGSDILEEVAWCGTNANGAIKQVGLLKPNELGIYDMSGNVWEYCSDVLGTGEIFSHGGSSYPGWNETYSDLEYRNVRSKANKAGRLGLRLVMDTAKYIPTPCKTFEVNGVKFNMMCVEGGTMTIGAGDIMEYRRRPEHKTTISDFYIGQTQVTQELWQAVMGDNPSVFKSDTSSSHPVENVSVIDIQEFLTKLNAMTGVNFRLPTEAEWEYAARGGQKSKGFMYAGSDDCNQVAWYGVSDNNGGTTHPVAQKCPNELGLYDMHGNVWEWLHDRYADTINIYPSVNPTGFISNLKASPVACGSAYYSDLGPSKAWGWVGVGSISTRSSWFGFRLALSDEDPFMAIDVNNYRFHMMLVKGGTFQMGAASTDATALENERPAHQVTLPDYYAGQTEVTRALWKTVMGSLPDGGEADNKPITNVNYDECQTFITQLNDLTGRHFRLPTEAEWEFAARGGNQSKGYLFAGSNNIDSVAWHEGNSEKMKHNVGEKMPNELGIYDMSGNVFEWCSDWYGDYASNAQINPQGAASGTQRVGRGGGYRAEDNRCRVTRRIPTDPEQRMTTLGLRLVLDKHAYVDLGLSVLWATTNLGATQPEEYGDYFAWGETEPKDSYTRDNYKWRDNTKYNNSGGLTSIQLEDDAAHVNWGGEWRMPTKEEYSELIEKCTWAWTQHKGINGYQVTGPNGNSIFLPATGYIGNGPSYPVGEYGLYWTTELNNSSINFSYMLIFGKNYTQRPSPNGSRFYGFSIRPVCPPPSI